MNTLWGTEEPVIKYMGLKFGNDCAGWCNGTGITYQQAEWSWYKVSHVSVEFHFTIKGF